MELLEKNGLSVEILQNLSYKSNLGLRLKKNLHYFDKDTLLSELKSIRQWYYSSELLSEGGFDYRIKSMQSILLKYDKFYPDHQVAKVFNDLLGFRIVCDNYNEIFSLNNVENMRIVDMTSGKAVDDGYRGVHAYFQLSNFHYPIEIQFNTYYDRQLSNWMHKYYYKKGYPAEIGTDLRKLYESGRIRSEEEFKEVLTHVLHRSEKF